MSTPAARLILASASPRRSELLLQIGLAHRIVPAHLDERRLPGESVEQCVTRLAQQKALTVWNAQPPGAASPLPVLGADTVVVLDGQLLGKPVDRDEALGMLARLSGREHEVYSAIALMAARGVGVRLARSFVRLRRLRQAECEAYWDSGEPADKAGAYAIQGLGAVFVEELRGSYSGVMGLPLFELAALLAAAGIDVPGLGIHRE